MIPTIIQQYAAEQEAARADMPQITIDDGDPYYLPPREVLLSMMLHQAVILNMNDAA